jgi:hypothetical protein
MTYTSGQLITSAEYNTFAQGGASVNHAVANINTVWGVGNNDKGYGQSTTLTPVSSGTTVVTAPQWATMVTRLNSILTHQAGAGSGITAPTTGTVVSILAALGASVTTAYTNRLTAATNATDVTGAAPAAASWLTATPTTFQITRTATWASADQARYFFNAGGKLILTFSAVDNTGFTKGTDWVALLNTKMASVTVGGYTNSRNGTGGTPLITNAAIGYWNVGTVNTTAISLTSASGVADYSSNSATVGIKTNGVQGANADVGTILTFTIDLNDVAADTIFSDNVNLTITTNITVRPPETTNLTTSITNPTIG